MVKYKIVFWVHKFTNSGPAGLTSPYLFTGMVKSIFGKYQVAYHPEGPEGPEWTIDFTPPFKRLRMFPDLEERMKEKLPAPDQLHTEEARLSLDRLCVKHKVDCSAPRTAARLLDKLVGEFLEETCVNPTFITEHPQVMSPLGKRNIQQTRGMQ